MTGDNTTVVSYRLARDNATGKEEYSTTPVLNGVSVHIGLERLERATLIDQANALNTFRLTSDDDLDISPADKVVDGNGFTYRVHTVQKERMYNGLASTIAWLTKKV